MQPWPDRRLLDLLKLEIPIIQAPMAGSDSVALARSVSSTGALGSLALPSLNADQLRILPIRLLPLLCGAVEFSRL